MSQFKYQKFNYTKTAYLYAGGNYPNSLITNKKALQNARLFLSAPLTDERCNYNALIEYVAIRKLKG